MLFHSNLRLILLLSITLLPWMYLPIHSLENTLSPQVSGVYFFPQEYDIESIGSNWLGGDLYAQGHYSTSLNVVPIQNPSNYNNPSGKKSHLQKNNHFGIRKKSSSTNTTLLFSFANYPTIKLNKPVYDLSSPWISSMKVSKQSIINDTT